MRLDLEHITAAYGGTVAVRDASLTVPSGSVVALLGPNGAGKTTLLSVASGLLHPKEGAVLLGAEHVTDTHPDQRVARGMCHIPEGRSIYPGLTVSDNLRMFATPGAESDAIDQAVEAFPKLGERRRQVAGTMSGGEQQMLALARAYCRQPELVLLDEVSLGLAPIIVDEIFEFLERLKRRGTSLLLVEQYVAKALAIADYVYLLVSGEIAHAAEPHELAGSDVFARYLGSSAEPVLN